MTVTDPEDILESRNILSPAIQEEIEDALELKHVTRLALGLAFLFLTLVFMPYLQEALNTMETTREQAKSLDTNWNTVSLGPGEYQSDSGFARKGDIFTIQFLVTTQYLVDRDKSVDFFIMDAENYQRYQNGESYNALLAEEDLESGTFSQEMPTRGVYYIVFDNNDDFPFEPEEEVKYRFVVYTFQEEETTDPVAGFALVLPSLALSTIGAFGCYSIYQDKKRRLAKEEEREEL